MGLKKIIDETLKGKKSTLFTAIFLGAVFTTSLASQVRFFYDLIKPLNLDYEIIFNKLTRQYGDEMDKKIQDNKEYEGNLSN